MPRSASRDLSDRYIERRDYFEQPHWIRRWKMWLSVLAILVAVGWGVADRVWAKKLAVYHTHGNVARVHAAWENDCEACHQPSSTASFWENGPLSLITGTQGRWKSLTCEKCHAGPVHHTTARLETPHGMNIEQDCAFCHHDHNGRNFSLTRIADSHCTVCHADLSAHSTLGQNVKTWSFGSFDQHTDFRPLHTVTEKGDLKPFDPGVRTLKFNHALHMAPGQVLDATQRGGKTLESLSPQDRARYGVKPGTDLVQLECSSCHQLDSGVRDAKYRESVAALAGQPATAILPPRAEGAYYLPVNFDLHCKSCHPIAFPATEADGKLLPRFDLPHRIQPTQMKEIVRGHVAQAMLKDNPERVKRPPSSRLDPRGKDANLRDFGEQLTRATDRTLALLTSQHPEGSEARKLADGPYCAKCHDLDGNNVKPVADRTVWFEHAAFNHASHRAMKCEECHKNGTEAVAPGMPVRLVDGRLPQKEPALIEGIKSCQVCHAPAKVGAHGEPTGGVRHQCTDCHRYHNNDQPLQGVGAPARAPSPLRTVGEFLRGGELGTKP